MTLATKVKTKHLVIMQNKLNVLRYVLLKDMNFGKRKVGKLWDDEFDIGTKRQITMGVMGSIVSNVLLERIQFF
jgi:hypothetical protein